MATGKKKCWRNRGDGHTNQALISPIVQILLWWLCIGNINVINIHPHGRSYQRLAFTQPGEGRIGACCSKRWDLTAKGFLFQIVSNRTCSTNPSKWKCVFEREWKQEDNSGNEGKGCTRDRASTEALLLSQCEAQPWEGAIGMDGRGCQRLCWREAMRSGGHAGSLLASWTRGAWAMVLFLPTARSWQAVARLQYWAHQLYCILNEPLQSHFRGIFRWQLLHAPFWNSSLLFRLA